MLVYYLLFTVGHGNTGVSTVALAGVPWFRGLLLYAEMSGTYGVLS